MSISAAKREKKKSETSTQIGGHEGQWSAVKTELGVQTLNFCKTSFR